MARLARTHAADDPACAEQEGGQERAAAAQGRGRRHPFASHLDRGRRGVAGHRAGVSKAEVDILLAVNAGEARAQRTLHKHGEAPGRAHLPRAAPGGGEGGAATRSAKAAAAGYCGGSATEAVGDAQGLLQLVCGAVRSPAPTYHPGHGHASEQAHGSLFREALRALVACDKGGLFGGEQARQARAVDGRHAAAQGRPLQGADAGKCRKVALVLCLPSAAGEKSSRESGCTVNSSRHRREP
jgi:hypothetical protein